jgi:hypothetical protein
MSQCRLDGILGKYRNATVRPKIDAGHQPIADSIQDVTHLSPAEGLLGIAKSDIIGAAGGKVGGELGHG